MKILIEKISYDDIPEENKHGNCFVVALNTFLENPQKYTLVHGVVTGQGAIEGIQYCHAWVENGNKVIDNTIPLTINKDIYYRIGHIKITRKYNASETMRMLEKYETYGPWDKVFDNYM